MKSQTLNLLELYKEAHTRFDNLLQHLTENDLPKKLHPNSNSIGFLIRHIGDVEFLFAKNVFGNAALKVQAKTVIAQHDTGEWIHLAELIEYVRQSYAALAEIIQLQTDADWETSITTKEFGTKTKAEAMGRIVSHTAYHAGQLALILKYSN